MHRRDEDAEPPKGLIEAWLDRLRGLLDDVSDALVPQPVPVPIPVRPSRPVR